MSDTNPTSHRTWIFQANPKLYDIDAALSNLLEMSWSVNQYKSSINIGDSVFIWRSGEDSGIVALATVLSSPSVSEQDGMQFAVQPEKFDTAGLRVRLRIDRVCSPPLSRTSLMAMMPDLSIIQSAQGTNFSVTPEEAAIIRDILSSQREDADEIPLSPGTKPVGGSRVWAYSPGPKAEYWEEFYRDGIIAIGWDELGDLRQYPDRNAVAKALSVAYKVKGLPTNDSKACFDFVRSMAAGDRVIAKRGRDEVVGYGIITGEYEFQPERPSYRNVRQVRWDRRGNWKSKPVFATKTLTDFTPFPEAVNDLEILIGASQPSSVKSATPILPQYTLEHALRGVAFEKSEFVSILDTWHAKKNIILQGPPGVGKTFLARRLAYTLIGYESPSRVAMVQFHQSYSYEDFIQGYRPTQTGFSLRDGVFVRFCRNASLDQESKYIFIIDEINRSNLSKVFGELLMLVEADKRGSKNSIALTYSLSDEQQFYVPPNVYILGMMNTADRSLAFVDYALRRRFAFVNLQPMFGSPTFVDFLVEGGTDRKFAEAVAERLRQLNSAIEKDSNLGVGFMVGHSYFCGNGGLLIEKEYRRVIRYEVLPLLEEYWIDDDRKMTKTWALKLEAAFESN